ncbi:MAG: hypothetical protein QOH61_608 [Chloroflexota bacterium]|jgi:hypothetical protein|nr:hypothetical protein [Chloroflexota bacterium]
MAERATKPGSSTSAGGTQPGPAQLSRRALVTAASAAVGAVAVNAIAGPNAAFAGVEYVRLGEGNESTVPTSISFAAGDTSVELGGSDWAVRARTDHGDTIGVLSEVLPGEHLRATAVEAYSAGLSSQTAVIADGRRGNGEGYALKAYTKNGVAVFASCTGGFALETVGPIVSDRSGRFHVATGKSSFTISGHRVTADSLVLATVQGYVAGVWVVAATVNVGTQKFTVRLNKPAPRALTVGWFLVN